MTVMGKEENKTRKRKHSHFRFGFGAFITNMNNDDAKERENAHLSPVVNANLIFLNIKFVTVQSAYSNACALDFGMLEA